MFVVCCLWVWLLYNNRTRDGKKDGEGSQLNYLTTPSALWSLSFSSFQARFGTAVARVDQSSILKTTEIRMPSCFLIQCHARHRLRCGASDSD